MMSEILVILMVSLIVFGPKKLPMLATHLGLLVQFAQKSRSRIHALWDRFNQEEQLKINLRKADEADSLYRE